MSPPPDSGLVGLGARMPPYGESTSNQYGLLGLGSVVQAGAGAPRVLHGADARSSSRSCRTR
eukprot:8873399-Alexandrium_andersonii.AAC.1